MLLCTLAQVSIFVGLAISQQGGFSDGCQGGMSSITQLASTPSNFAWTNTSTGPPEATIEIQFDGLAGSGVINLTSHAGFSIINVTPTGTASGSLSPWTTDLTSAGIQSTGGTTTVAPSNRFTLPPTMTNSPIASNASTNLVLPTMPPTSTNIGIFTDSGVLSKTLLLNTLIWLFLGLLPAVMMLVG